ncbi:MAG: hypothetical protein R2737_13480 [Candidatus Nanopelagicales bacterium]
MTIDISATDVSATTTTTTTTTTQAVCFAAPLLPGTTDRDREEMLACGEGARRGDHAASRRRHGITREAVWIQSTPVGDFAVVLLESRDLPRALHGLATSAEPFDAWFRSHLLAVHGMDLAEGMSLPEQVLDYRA